VGRVIAFHPPPLPVTSELDWVFHRAFAAPEAQRAAPIPRDKREALTLATALGLGATIAQRTPPAVLRAELGADGSAALEQALLSQTAHGLALRKTAARFGAAADATGKAVILLKHAALDALGVAGPSTRSACDVDVLVRRSDLAEIGAAAEHAGFTRDARWPSELHPLRLMSAGPERLPVECHVGIPNVRPDAHATDATLETLETAGVLRPAAGFPSSVRVAADHVLAAHMLSHALAQHRFTPAYCPTRLLVDGTLLGLDTRPELTERALRHVGHCVDQEEVRALVELLALLRRGTPVAAINEASGPSRLLAHVVHAATSQLYADSLLLARQRQRLSEDGLGSWLVHHAATLFSPKARRAPLEYETAPTDRAARGAREPLRSATELARGLAASARLWIVRRRSR
jgi:hypothetical protein